jgi:osmotically-inducible protein OsmY
MISLKPPQAERARRSAVTRPPRADDLDRLELVLTDALRRSGYQSLRALQCQVTEGGVVLTGVVRSYYLKQLAQETVRRISPADRIDNRVLVEYSNEAGT